MSTDHAAVEQDPSRNLRELMARGRFQDALEAWHRMTAQDQTAQPPDAQLLAATAATRLGRMETAAILASAALNRFRSRGDGDGRMRAMNLLGAIAWEQGRLPDAENHWDEALRLSRELDDSLMLARVSNNLALLADLRGRTDVALSLCRTALLAHLRLGDRRGAAEAYHNLGIAFRQRGELADAEDSADQAIRHATLLEEPSLLALALMGRVEVEAQRGELALARRGLDRAAQLAREAGDELGHAEALRLGAVLALQEGDAERAARDAEEARLTAERLRSALLRAEAAAVAARALRRLGEEGLATQRYQEARQMFLSLEATTRLEELEECWKMEK